MRWFYRFALRMLPVTVQDRKDAYLFIEQLGSRISRGNREKLADRLAVTFTLERIEK